MSVSSLVQNRLWFSKLVSVVDLSKLDARSWFLSNFEPHASYFDTSIVTAKRMCLIQNCLSVMNLVSKFEASKGSSIVQHLYKIGAMK